MFSIEVHATAMWRVVCVVESVHSKNELCDRDDPGECVPVNLYDEQEENDEKKKTDVQ